MLQANRHRSLKAILLAFVCGFLSQTAAPVCHGQGIGNTLRIVSYNIQDKPTTSAHDADIRTIIDAIGDYEISDVARPIDLFAFQEGPQSVASLNFLESDFEQVFGGNYQVIYATADPNGDRTGYVYNTATLTLLSSDSIDNMGFTHRPLLATFQPVGGEPQDVFSIITLHLKAGSTSSDENQRESEANAVGQVVNSLPAGRPFIFLGDFNMKGSDEDAWTGFVNAGGRDTINAPVGLRIANWENSIAFHPFHTQDTTGFTGGMDDRFDVMLVNSEMMDNTGIEFNRGSLSTLENNGSHTLNSNILSGNGNSNVQMSLMDISDHLPIFADFDWGVTRFTPDSVLSDLASNNYTVLTSGPRTGSDGTALFQVEGSDNGSFAAFGVVDFDLTGVLATGDVGLQVDSISLELQQDNASFTRDGPVSVYIASPFASTVTMDSSIQYQAGQDGLACVPSILSLDAQLAAKLPSIHHASNGSDLPDGSESSFMLYGDAIQTAILNSMNGSGNLRLIVVPENEDTAATFAGITNGQSVGPTIQGFYQANGGQKPWENRENLRVKSRGR